MRGFDRPAPAATKRTSRQPGKVPSIGVLGVSDRNGRLVMDRELAMELWREVTKGAPDGVATGRTLEKFAGAVEAAIRKTCAVACAQALCYARADELEHCIKVCADLANDEEWGHLYSTGASEAERQMCERRKTPNV